MRDDRRRFFVGAVAVVLLTVAIRLPSLCHPLAIDDERIYSVVANEIVDGGRPYADAVERKPPLLFWTYAAIYKAAGKYNWKALHGAALLWTLATMAGLFSIARRLFDLETGLVAALFYSIFQPWGPFINLAFNGEVMMNLPIVLAWGIGLAPPRSRLRPELLGAGALLAAAFLLKQPAAIAAVPLGLYLLLPAYRRQYGQRLRDVIAQAALLTIGFAMTLGFVAMILWRQGILADAFLYTITNHSIPLVFWKRGVLHTLAFSAACLPLLIGAALAYRDRDGLWRVKSAERMALFGLVAASSLGVAASARFYPHYYIQMLPPLALLSAPHYAHFWSRRGSAPASFLRPRITFAWLALLVVGFDASHWWGEMDRRQPSNVGLYLRTISKPSDRIFVWGATAAIYLDARRRPASRYVLTFPLTGMIYGERVDIDTRNRIVPGAWENLAEDFRRHPPAFIADLYIGENAQYPAQDFPFLATLLERDYEPVLRSSEYVIYRRNPAR